MPGLSPPTRGSQQLPAPAHGRRGSIPAHTGKPDDQPRQLSLARVYPRPHGEAMLCSARTPTTGGLSPPTRGSHAPAPNPVVGVGSIPAHTGKPGATSPSRP